MNRTNARTSQHGKRGFGNHGHVNQNTITFDNAKVLQNSGHALHFCVQVFVGVCFFLLCLRRNKNQGRLVTTVFEVPIDCVVAQIGSPTDEPLGKGGIRVIADLLGLGLPIHCSGLFSPETVAICDGTLVKLLKRTHGCPLTTFNNISIMRKGDLQETDLTQRLPIYLFNKRFYFSKGIRFSAT